MTLLETTYKSLHDCDLTKSTRDFSTKYLNRNANWYSYQTHKNRDFSLTAAVAFVKSVNNMIEQDVLDAESKRALLTSKFQISNYLKDTHSLYIV